MPPPLPRSSTTSPGAREARAVGLPQPSEAKSAAFGISDTSTSLYKLPVILSPQQDWLASVAIPPPTLPPQQAAPFPSSTVSAAVPYFCRTISRTSARSVHVSAIVFPSFRVNQQHPPPVRLSCAKTALPPK